MFIECKMTWINHISVAEAQHHAQLSDAVKCVGLELLLTRVHIQCKQISNTGPLWQITTASAEHDVFGFEHVSVHFLTNNINGPVWNQTEYWELLGNRPFSCAFLFFCLTRWVRSCSMLGFPLFSNVSGYQGNPAISLDSTLGLHVGTGSVACGTCSRSV